MSKFEYDDCFCGGGIIYFWLCEDEKTITMICNDCYEVYNPNTGDSDSISHSSKHFFTVRSEIINEKIKGKRFQIMPIRPNKLSKCGWANYKQVVDYGWEKYIEKEALIHHKTYKTSHCNK